MLTMREIGPEGLSAKKNRDWNKPELLVQWREQWAVQANHALERAGREERIDHRSLADQGSERLPQVHLGPHAAALEKRGVATEKGDHNRAVVEHNAVVVDLEKAREEKRLLVAEKAVMERYSGRLKSGWSTEHAQALGRLEYQLGGSELTYGKVSELKDGYTQELSGIQQQLDAINSEGNRLNQATELLEARRAAAAEVERQKSPVATVKRLFSADARNQFGEAQSRLSRLDERLRHTGTTSGEELQQQRQRWQQDRLRVPALEEKGARLSQAIEVAAKALHGFSWEREVQELELYRGRRNLSRDIDRGR
jgi:DNA repair exonuclease SbcCD ATPase subunit